jgi:hypothetical protein
MRNALILCRFPYDPRGGLAKVLAIRVELLDMVFKSSDKIRHGSSCNEHPFKTMHSAE